jgi:hypothetical protein
MNQQGFFTPNTPWQTSWCVNLPLVCNGSSKYCINTNYNLGHYTFHPIFIILLEIHYSGLENKYNGLE